MQSYSSHVTWPATEYRQLTLQPCTQLQAQPVTTTCLLTLQYYRPCRYQTGPRNLGILLVPEPAILIGALYLLFFSAPTYQMIEKLKHTLCQHRLKSWIQCIDSGLDCLRSESNAKLQLTLIREQVITWCQPIRIKRFWNWFWNKWNGKINFKRMKWI